MKKIISSVLAFIMVISTFQYAGIVEAATIKNEEKDELILSDKIFVETANGLQVEDRNHDGISGQGNRQESAFVTWGVGDTLEFFVETLKGTKKIVVEPSIEEDSKNYLKINFGDIDIKGNKIQVRKFNNANGWSSKTENILLEGDEYIIKKEIDLESDSDWNVEDTTFNIACDIEGVGTVQMIFKFNKSSISYGDLDIIDMYVTGINKGYVTPFRLNGEESSNKFVVNGPKDFEIEAIHIDENGDNIIIIDGENNIVPGSKPGIKVSFDKFKGISDSGNFEDIKEGEERFTISIGKKNSDKGIDLFFIMNANRLVELSINGKKQDSVEFIDITQDKFEFYITQDETRVKKEDGTFIPSIPWGDLEESMRVVNDSFEYNYKTPNKLESHYDTNLKGDQEFIGGTYLEYVPIRVSESGLGLEIKPYITTKHSTYKIHMLSHGMNIWEDMSIEEIKERIKNSSKPVAEYNFPEGVSEPIRVDIDTGIKEDTDIIKDIIIEVIIDGQTYISQVLYYNPDEYPITAKPTYIEKIYNLYVAPSKEDDNPRTIGFDIIWTQPDNLEDILKRGKVYYEMIIRKEPDDKDPNLNGVTKSDAFYSKVFEVSKGVDKNGNEIPIVGILKNGNVEDKIEHEFGKDFNFTDVNIKNLDEDGWEQVVFDKDNYMEDYINSLTMNDGLKEKPLPGTYYVSFKTGFVQDGETKITYSGESNMVPITLDETNEIVPVPDEITFKDKSSKDKTLISEEINISNVDIQKYIDIMLDPVNLELYIEDKDGNELSDPSKYYGYYELYLYQKQTDEIDTDVNKFILPEDDGSIDLSQIYNGENDCIDILEKGGVIPILIPTDKMDGKGINKIQLDGLNPNEVYYIQARVKLTPRDIEDTSKKSDARYSIFSKEFTFTTTRPPLPPTAEDKKPGAPEKIWVIDKPNNTSVNIGWSPVKDKDDNKIYYEFVRTDLSLSTQDQEKSVEDIVAKNGSNVGFKTDESNIVVSKYTSKDNKWVDIEDPSNTPFILKDKDLSPNTIYYYYVRTVVTIDDETFRSEWISVPVTTDPIFGVINLKVESSKDYSYDEKRETVISFDAPVPSESMVPDKYDFDIAVKGELDEEYLTDKYSVTKITSKEDPDLVPEGYVHFVYRIKDLKPNKRYYIKVRVVDKTKELVAGEHYPTSLYSNAVSTRTEFDEEEDNKDNKFEEYLKKYEQEVEKLRRRPYWVVDNNGTYKYRETYISTELKSTSQYQLVSDKESTSLYYYLPASLFKTENGSQAVIDIIMQNNSLSIRPNTLTESTKQIESAIELMNDNQIRDYYVGIDFRLGDNIGRVCGEETITPEIKVTMEIVHSNTQDLYVEERIMDELNSIIDDEKEHFIDELEEEVYEGSIAPEVLDDILLESIENIEQEHVYKTRYIMRSITKKVVDISTLERPLLLAITANKSNVNAYYNLNGWFQVDSYGMGNSFKVEVDRLGAYIFTGRIALSVTNPALGPYEDFISTYNLTDFFGTDALSMNKVVTKEQLYGALARVIGAPRGSDYVNYLNINGIKGISNIGLSTPIRQDQLIYVVMQGYEKVTHRNIGTVVIQNRLSVQNIGAFQSIYRTYVYAGVELKIIDNPGNKVIPSQQMTVDETIKILSKLK